MFFCSLPSLSTSAAGVANIVLSCFVLFISPGILHAKPSQRREPVEAPPAVCSSRMPFMHVLMGSGHRCTGNPHGRGLNSHPLPHSEVPNKVI